MFPLGSPLLNEGWGLGGKFSVFFLEGRFVCMFIVLTQILFTQVRQGRIQMFSDARNHSAFDFY